jgi:ubiquitin
MHIQEVLTGTYRYMLI